MRLILYTPAFTLLPHQRGFTTARRDPLNANDSTINHE